MGIAKKVGDDIVIDSTKPCPATSGVSSEQTPAPSSEVGQVIQQGKAAQAARKEANKTEGMSNGD